MPTIDVVIKNKIAQSPDEHIVCGNSDYIINFVFDAEWQNYETKTARFTYGGNFTDVIFDGNACPAPVMRNTTVCTVGVFAGDLKTTTPALITCDKSVLCGDGSPADPAPDVYNQLMEKLNSIDPDVGGGGGSGTTDHSKLFNRDKPDQHPIGAITGLKEALANAGGGSVDLSNYYTKTETDKEIAEAVANSGGGSKWRLIRTVTIPEDITTDTSGVAFAEKTDGGIIFAFDTDEDGQPFSCTEFIVYTEVAGTPQASMGEARFALNESKPGYFGGGSGATLFKIYGVSYNNGSGYGVSYFVSLGKNGSFAYGTTFGGGGANNVQTTAKNNGGVAKEQVTALSAFMSNGGTYGFKVGSTFKIYGR